MSNKLVEYDDELLPELISPEGLQIAEAYLAHGQDAKKAALALGINEPEVRRMLKTPEVRSYTNQVFMETGFRNRERMFGVMDELINRKLEEIEETGTTTDADILELMDKYHKMKIAEMKMEKELYEAKTRTAPSTQNNTQINLGGNISNYDKLISALAKGK